MDDDDDMHMCLVCHRTISGLLNYVNHKKSECAGRKPSKVLPEPVFPAVNSVADMRNQTFGLGTSASYISNSYTANGQQIFSSADSFQRPEVHDTVHVLNSQTGITSTLDVFDTAQFQSSTADADAHLQDICLKGYSLPTTQITSVTHTLFDSQAAITNQQSSCDLAAFGLSPSIFTSASRNLSKNRDTTVSQENHGLLNACISNSVEADFSSAVNIHIPSTFPILNSDKSPNPNGAAININEIISDNHSKSQATNKTASEKVDDFFQSLELMSKSNPKTEKGASFSQPLLPISNILNNLTFSSDEEDLGFNFADDVSLDSMSDDSEGNTAPPSDYTGAKWKPGERPGPSSFKKNRPTYRGKWPPGQVPEQTSAKYYGARPKGGKNISSLLASRTKKTKGQKQTKSTPASAKTFRCNFCDMTFHCRFKYSNHCGSVAHKEKVFGKRDYFPSTYGKGEGKSVAVKEKDVADEGNEVTAAKIEESPEPDESPETVESPELDESPEPESRASEITEEQLCDKEVQEAEVEESVTHEKVDNGSLTREEENGVTEENQFYSAVPLPIHVCTVCDKKFPNKYFISNHLLTKYHRNRAMAQKETAFALLETYHKYIVRLSPFQCSICRFYFNTANFLESHLKSEAHKANCEDLVGELTCSLCRFKTHNHSDLLDHMDSPDHTRNISKLKKLCVIKESHVQCRCKYCGLIFKSFTRLRRHVQLKHSDGQAVVDVVKRQIGIKNRPQCSECNQRFQSASALKLHIRRRHTGEKPYQCEKCDSSFTGKHALSMHFKTAKHMQRQLDFENEKTRVTREKKETPNEIDSDSKNNTVAVETVNTAVESVITETETVNNGLEGVADSIVRVLGVKKQTTDTVGRERKNEVPEIKIEADCNIGEEIEVGFVDDDYMLEDTDVGDFGDVDAEDEWTPPKKTGKRSRHISKKLKDFLPMTEEKKMRRKRTRRKKGEIPIKIHKCDHCSFTANSYNDLRPHYLKEHSAQIKICELCDLVYLSDKAYKLHVLSKEHQQNINRTGSNVAEKYYTCHICKKKFTDEKYCKFHTAYQHFHLTSEEAVLMEYDGKDVTRLKYEKVLDEIKDLDQTASVQCPECKNLLKKSNFIEHLRIHSGDKPFKCKMCAKAFISSVTLRRHLLGHFGCQERTCEVCGKHFKKIPSFEEHMKLHLAQSGDVGKVHTCEVCGQAFYFEHQLQFHLRRHRKREFACTFPGCHWKFVFATELKYHMHSHTQYKPFLCDICGYATVSKCRLKRHHRTHTGERNYHCEYCTYKAGNSTHLHRHMRIHIGSKPFKCPYCQYSCNTHENMRKHIVQTKKHEGLSIYPCKFCKYGTNSCKDFRNHLLELHEDEIGENFHMSALSTFTGLYDKSLDPKEPEEGNRIYQVRERIPRDPKSKKPKKSRSSKTEENKGDVRVKKSKREQEESKNLIDMNGKKNSDLIAKRDVESSVKNESYDYQWTIVPYQDDSRQKTGNTYGTKHLGLQMSTDAPVRTQVSDIPSSYFSSSTDQIRLHNLEQVPQNLSTNQLVPLSQYKIPSDTNLLKPEYPAQQPVMSGLNLSQMQFHSDGTDGSKVGGTQSQKMRNIQSGDRRPPNMMYHNYCTKFGSNSENDGTGNLVIDMNFSNTQ